MSLAESKFFDISKVKNLFLFTFGRSTTHVRTVTDIYYYKALDESHLHQVEAQSTKRKFLLKLAEYKNGRIRNNSLAPFYEHKQYSPNEMANIISERSKVKIPERIYRSSTDVLRALACTVSRDFGSADYVYHDDPYLIPYNSLQKRDYALSKKSGIATARYILNKHPELFENNLIECEPKIKAFMPKVLFNEKNASVELLENLVASSNNVSDAVILYECLVRKNVEINTDLKFSLLEMICFYNEEDNNIVESDHNIISGMNKQFPSVWKRQDGLAHKIYTELKIVRPDASRPMLRGMSRYGEYQDAWKMFEECRKNNIGLSVQDYNAALKSYPADSDNFSKNWGGVIEILHEMSKLNIRPDKQTMDSLLFILLSTKYSNYSEICKLALSVLAEFKTVFNISPSLTSYTHLINIFGKDSNRSQILIDIIREIKATNLDVNFLNSGEDLNFFVTAIEYCHHQMSANLKLAYDIHQIVTSNGVLLGNFNNVNRYYKAFASILFKNEPIDVAMQFYNKFTPHVWSPSHTFYLFLLREINAQAAYQYLPKVWTDLQARNYNNIKMDVRFEFNFKFLEVISSLLSDSKDCVHDESLNASFLAITKEAFNQIENYVVLSSSERFQRGSNSSLNIPCLTPSLSVVFSIGLRLNDAKLCLQTFQLCLEHALLLSGCLETFVLDSLMDIVLQDDMDLLESQNKIIYQLISYAHEHYAPEEFNTVELANKARNVMQSCFSEVERRDIDRIFAKDISWQPIST